MLLVGATAGVLLAAACQARLLRLQSLDALLGTLVLAVAHVVLLSFGLAAASHYSAGTVFVASLASAALSVAAYASRRHRLPEWRPPLWRPRLPRTPVEWLTAMLVGLVAVHFFVRIVLAVRLVPYGYDAVSYHLAAVGWVVQDGRLPGPRTGILASGYPLGGEMLAAWPAVLLHDDVLSRLPQILMAILGGLATTAAARGVGLDRALSSCAGCMFLLTPALLAQMTTAYVDVTVAALSMAAVAFLVRWSVTGRGSGLLALGGLSAGLAAGTKHTGIIVALVCCVGATVVGARRGLRSGLAAGATVGVPVALAGGGWYLENLLVHGNPLYPFDFLGLPSVLAVADLTTEPPGPSLPEPVPTLWSWAHDLVPQFTYTYEQRTGGLGTVFVWLGLPCLLVVLARAIRRREVPWLLLAGLVLAPFLLQPYRWWARFTLPLAALTAIAVAEVLATLVVVSRQGGLKSRIAWAAPVAVAVAVLAAQPTLLARTVTPTDGNPSIAAWMAFTVPAGDRLANGPRRPDSLRGIVGADVVAVAADEVARTGLLFGPQFQREVRPVDSSSRQAFSRSITGADALVACRDNEIGQWAAEDPRLRLVSDPDAALAVWQIRGADSDPVTTDSPDRTAQVYCG
jgi:hypothetical protein